MGQAFLTELRGLFDRRFIIAYWCPIFIGLASIVGLMFILLGPEGVFKDWSGLDEKDQIVLGVGSLLGVIFLAFVLDAFTTPLIRLYRGHWIQKKITWLVIHFPKRSIVAQGSADTTHLWKLTQLDNALRSAEQYSYQVYRLDAATWWPRLATLLPETFRTQIDATLLPLVALLNLSTIFIIIICGGGVTTMFIGKHWWLGLLVCVVGLALTRLCYLAAVSQAVDYGLFIRVAFDLYRQDILKQMHVPIPDNLLQERLLWDALNSVMQYSAMPWEAKAPAHLSQLKRPFYYDTHDKSTEMAHP